MSAVGRECALGDKRVHLNMLISGTAEQWTSVTFFISKNKLIALKEPF